MARGFLFGLNPTICNLKSNMKGGGYHESRKDQGKEPDRCEEEGPGLLLL